MHFISNFVHNHIVATVGRRDAGTRGHFSFSIRRDTLPRHPNAKRKANIYISIIFIYYIYYNIYNI